MKKRRALWLVIPILAILAAGWIYAYNYANFQQPLEKILAQDKNFHGITARAYLTHYVDARQVTLDLLTVEKNHSTIDLFDLLRAFAEEVGPMHFTSVVLACKGTPKFTLPGDYFCLMGEQYQYGNREIAARDFPSHLRRMNGDAAFETYPMRSDLSTFRVWQIRDHMRAHLTWYGKDLGFQFVDPITNRPLTDIPDTPESAPKPAVKTPAKPVPTPAAPKKVGKVEKISPVEKKSGH